MKAMHLFTAIVMVVLVGCEPGPTKTGLVFRKTSGDQAIDLRTQKLIAEKMFMDDPVFEPYNGPVEDCPHSCSHSRYIYLNPDEASKSVYIIGGQYCSPDINSLDSARKDMQIGLWWQSGLQDYNKETLWIEDPTVHGLESGMFTDKGGELSTKVVTDSNAACYLFSISVSGLKQGLRYAFNLAWRLDAPHTNADGVTQVGGYAEDFIVDVGDVP